MAPEAFLCALVIVAAATDMAARRIPNLLPLAGLGIALACQLLAAREGAVLASLGGALAGLCLFLPLYALHGMAAGDVKLMAAVGAFVGPLGALKIGLLSFVVGGVLALLFLLAGGHLAACLRNLRTLYHGALWRLHGLPRLDRPAIVSVGGIPYALAIALSTLGLLYWERG